MIEDYQTLKAEVERLRIDQRVGLYTAAKLIEVERERDAAIARAEKRDADYNILMRERNNFWESNQTAIAQRDTARAAHAEAMGLLQEWWEEGGPKLLVARTYAHLTKYGKDVGK